jgi:hypothetical protein
MISIGVAAMTGLAFLWGDTGVAVGSGLGLALAGTSGAQICRIKIRQWDQAILTDAYAGIFSRSGVFNPQQDLTAHGVPRLMMRHLLNLIIVIESRIFLIVWL